jgi:hypothetical protein
MTVQEAIAVYTTEEGKKRWVRGVDNDYYDMAAGGDACGVRQQYYPGWSNQDFIEVIVAVEGSYEP